MDNDGYIRNDWQLLKEAESIAQDTFDRIKAENPELELSDLVDQMQEDLWQSVDQSQHVIYTYRAKLIAGNCDCSDGEEYLEGIYGKPFDGCETYADVVTRLAFAQLMTMAESALRDLINAEEEEV